MGKGQEKNQIEKSKNTPETTCNKAFQSIKQLNNRTLVIQKKKINQIDYKSRKQRTEKPQLFES